jgi:CRP/FNR family transcriptional regulator, cyclic AMP receptor protein
MPCDPQLLEGVGLFKHLDEAGRVQLAKAVRSRTLTVGQELFRVGEPGEALYIVRSGQVELYIRDTTGQKIPLAIARDNEVFGELALLDRGPRTATALALVDCELLELDRDDLLTLFRTTPDAALQLLAAMGHMTRAANELLKTRVSRNVNVETAEQLSTFDRIADWISWFSGSMLFLLLNAAWFTLWIGLNTLPLGFAPFDPYPFGLLTMIVSLEAIFLSCFVLLSQSRQAAKDRVRADIEYEINVKAELEVAHLHEKTDRIHTDLLHRFHALEKQLAARQTSAR